MGVVGASTYGFAPSDISTGMFWLITSFPNGLIVTLVTADPDIILATIDRNFLAFAICEISIGIPKNLISAMSAFVVSFLFGFVGNFLFHKFIFLSLGLT